MYLIYKHILTVECAHKGWSYIGQTCQKPKARWKSGNSYKNQVFGKAIKKYGWDAFEHTILKENIKTAEEANYWEIYYIKQFHTWILDENCHGYNVLPGGNDRSTFGKVVLQLDKDKNIINEYISICEAARAINCPPDRISRCCNHLNNVCSVNGYYWCFKQDYANFSPAKLKNRAIYQLDKNKNILNKFASAAEASRYLKMTESVSIRRCLAGKAKSAFGYYWCFVDDYDDFKVNQSTYLRKIYCVELNKLYNSSIEATKDVGVSYSVILRCCRGLQNTAAGYHWEFRT